MLLCYLTHVCIALHGQRSHLRRVKIIVAHNHKNVTNSLIKSTVETHRPARHEKTSDRLDDRYFLVRSLEAHVEITVLYTYVMDPQQKSIKKLFLEVAWSLMKYKNLGTNY